MLSSLRVTLACVAIIAWFPTIAQSSDLDGLLYSCDAPIAITSVQEATMPANGGTQSSRGIAGAFRKDTGIWFKPKTVVTATCSFDDAVNRANHGWKYDQTQNGVPRNPPGTAGETSSDCPCDFKTEAQAMVDSEQAYKFTVAKSSIKWYTITFDLCKEYAVDGGSIRGSADGGHYPNHERYEDNELHLQFKSENGEWSKWTGGGYSHYGGASNVVDPNIDWNGMNTAGYGNMAKVTGWKTMNSPIQARYIRLAVVSACDTAAENCLNYDNIDTFWVRTQTFQPAADEPALNPTPAPATCSHRPWSPPTAAPTPAPTPAPNSLPTSAPTPAPTSAPTPAPTSAPASTPAPTLAPSPPTNSGSGDGTFLAPPQPGNESEPIGVESGAAYVAAYAAVNAAAVCFALVAV